MSLFSKTQSHHPCFSVGDVDTAVAEPGSSALSHFEVAECWREVPADLPGARLFRLEQSGGAPVCWLAEVTTGERTHRRRCASELYARWWLHALVEPVRSLDPILLARLDEPQLSVAHR
jgi:hypothetical protein